MNHNHPLWKSLITAGVLQTGVSHDDQSERSTSESFEIGELKDKISPWYIKMLLAISGWLGAVFILGFVFMLMNDLFDEPVTAGLFGLSLVIAAYFIIRIPKNEFFEHLGLAISLAGQALVVFSVIDSENDSINWLLVGLFHVVLTAVMENFVHRVFSAFFATFSFDIGCTLLGAPYMVSSVALMVLVMFYVNEFKSINTYQQVSGVVYGLVIYWLIVLCLIPFNVEMVDFLLQRHQPIFELPIEVIQSTFVAAIMFSLWKLVSVNKLSLGSTQAQMVLGTSLLFSLLTLNAPGFSAAIIIIVLGFSRSNRVMMGFGIVALLIYYSAYYYMMEETLLYKSGVLLAIAVVTLVSRILLIKLWPITQEQ
jgi:hypothetical protein